MMPAATTSAPSIPVLDENEKFVDHAHTPGKTGETGEPLVGRIIETPSDQQECAPRAGGYLSPPAQPETWESGESGEPVRADAADDSEPREESDRCVPEQRYNDPGYRGVALATCRSTSPRASASGRSGQGALCR